jgi:hypothetical protein
MQNEIKINDNINNSFTRSEHIKKKLISRYFYEFLNLPLNKLDVKMVYVENDIYKYLLLPKRHYRKYFLKLITPFSNEMISVHYKDKDEVKKMIFEINRNKN